MTTLQGVRLRLMPDSTMRAWASRLGLWHRVAMLLELEHRCLNGQFSKALYESVNTGLERECNDLSRRERGADA